MKWQTYRSKETSVPLLQPISQQDAHLLIKQAHEELDQVGLWPENLASWLGENNPDALRAIRASTRSVGPASKTLDSTGVVRALVEYKSAWIKGLDLWREHHTSPTSIK